MKYKLYHENKFVKIKKLEHRVIGQPYKTGLEKRNREGVGSPEKGTYDMMDLPYCAKIYVL